MKKKITVRLILNIFLVIIICVSWGKMFFGTVEDRVTARGIASLRYFTILSNLLEAAASRLWLINMNEKFKYVACVSVMLTFTVVIVFLGPLFGYKIMFSGVSLWFHLLVPLLSLFEILFLSDARYTRKDNLLVLIPLALYGTYYVGNNLINGIGKWPHSNDWYGFLSWGYPIGMVIYTLIFLVTWTLGRMIRFIKDRQR